MDNKSEIIIYRTQDGQSKIDVRMEQGTLWLSQMQMAELFQTTKQNVKVVEAKNAREAEKLLMEMFGQREKLMQDRGNGVPQTLRQLYAEFPANCR